MAQDQPPQKAHPAEPHKHFFLTTTHPERIAIADRRLRADQVRYTPVGDKVVIEGDIVLGTVDEISKAVVAQLVESAIAINPNDGALGLSATQKAVIRDLAALHKDDDPAAIAARKAAVQRLLARAIQVDSSSAKSALGGAAKRVDQLRKEAEAAATKGAQQNDPGTPETLVLRSLINPHQQWRWPNGVIPYVIDPTYPSPNIIQQAIAQWHAKTDRIRLVAVTQQNASQFQNWVRFVPDQGCSSRVGKMPTLGEQTINLADGCLVPQVVHEIGHCVGLWHEQSRGDRDQFIQVQPQHIDPGMLFNFDIVGPTDGVDNGPFDFGSIMLYPPKSFSIDGESAVIKLGDPTADFGIFTPGLGGKTKELSPGDLAGVEAMYFSPAVLPPGS